MLQGCHSQLAICQQVQLVDKLLNCRTITSCWNLEQLVTSLLSSTTLLQVVDKPLTTYQQAGNKQCEHILLTSCWNSIATSLLQICYNLCVFTCVIQTIEGSNSLNWDPHVSDFSYNIYNVTIHGNFSQ